MNEQLTTIANTPELQQLIMAAKWFAEQQWRGTNEAIVAKSVEELHAAALALARTQGGAQ